MRWVFVVAWTSVVLAITACTSSTVAPPPSSRHRSHTAAPSSTSRSKNATPSMTTSSSSPTSDPTSDPTSSPAPRAPAGPAQRALRAMSLAQRVGQLLMVDCPSSGVTSSTVESIQTYHAGSVILDGNNTQGLTHIGTLTQQLQQLAHTHVRLFIATDQEGGLVQRLKGPGFSTIPSAVEQGQMSPSALRSFTRRWGTELRSAGVNLDLAPVLDTVPSGTQSNPPIGDLDREYGRTPISVSRHGVAVASGLADAGVSATAKHFPGLGRVAGNTDTTSGVTDTVTTRHDAYLRPFAAAVRAGIPFVMVSSAEYSRIDRGTPAVFSRTIVSGMLRGDLGFRGVIVTDDIGAAAQVANVPPGLRAVRFIQAGGTMVLTVSPGTVAPMFTRLLDRAQKDPAFRNMVNAAALTVLRAKAARGLL
jgi:beta-N-acetylhexosaminidase